LKTLAIPQPTTKKTPMFLATGNILAKKKFHTHTHTHVKNWKHKLEMKPTLFVKIMGLVK
jgi:hypothetical protein